MKVVTTAAEEGTPREGTTYWMIHCPGCKMVPGQSDTHLIWSEKHTYNGNPDMPTFEPSLLKTSPDGTYICHSFVKDGMIRYLTDCTHPLAGQTVDLPEWK